MKNIIFDLGGVVVEWNAKRVLETFKGNPILVNFVKENSLFLNDWQDYDRGDVTRQELIDKVALLSGCPPEDCNEFIEHVKHSLTPIPETEAKLRKRTYRGKPIKEKTAQKYLTVVSAVLSDAKRNEIIEKNPARMIDLPDAERRAQEIPTMEEMQKFFSALC